ncbi:Protein of unknown function [Bacillus mobilis]|nr:Protein of unknown function [Bacillus mobilis]
MQLRNDEVRVDLLKVIVARVEEFDVAIYNTCRKMSNLQSQEQKGQ